MDGQDITGPPGVIGKDRVLILVKRAAGQAGPSRSLRGRGRFSGEQAPLGFEHPHKDLRQHLLVYQHEIAAFRAFHSVHHPCTSVSL